MNFGDLQARAAVLAQFEGWADVVPPPDWPTLVNRGWAQFSWEAECIVANSSIELELGTMDYLLTGGPWKKILDVFPTLTRSYEEFERFLNPGWRLASGVPARWILSGFNTLSLVPGPNAAAIAANPVAYVRGIVEGQPMVLMTDIPGQVNGVGGPIPDAFHEGIAARATWLQGIIYAQGEALSRLAAYETRFHEYAEDCIKAMRNTYERDLPGGDAPAAPSGGQ